jgi:hypothetical protein
MATCGVIALRGVSAERDGYIHRKTGTVLEF